MLTVIDTKDFKELKSLMEEDAGEELEMWEDNGRIFINGLNAELMLRLQYYKKTLVIARMMVSHRRTGVGTSILNWLINYANQHGYEVIELESTLTHEINQFAKKYNFTPDTYNGIYMDGEFFGNWKLFLKS